MPRKATFTNRRHRQGRDNLGMAQPSKIAACYDFLASDEASLVTGAVLAADGGGRTPIQIAAAGDHRIVDAAPNCLANSLSSGCGTTLL
jgi:NAD(P)-dependent dehydrogenase (short-subunit alcohol dehydrogenase family)